MKSNTDNQRPGKNADVVACCQRVNRIVYHVHDYIVKHFRNAAWRFNTLFRHLQLKCGREQERHPYPYERSTECTNHIKNNNMDVEVKNKANRRHVGHNLQKIRVYFGMKQEALAADLGVNQQVISKIEKQEEIEEGLLNQIASVLGISAEVIKDFDVEKAIYNINNIRDNTFEQGATSIAQQFNPLDKIVELYERLLQSEREKIELLKNK